MAASMSDGMMRNMAVEVAVALGKLRGETWTSADGEGRGEYTLTGPGQARLALDFHVYGNDSKLTVQGLYPEGCGGKMFYAGVNPERGASVIAKAASNRVLAAGYADQLLVVLARKAQADASQAETDAWLDQAAKLFEVDRSDGHGKDKLDLSELTGKRCSVEVFNYRTEPMTVSVKMHGLDPDAALAMLRALAGHARGQVRCCRVYGPGHHPDFAIVGCLREKSGRGEGPSKARVASLLRGHGISTAQAAAALDDARTSRYQVSVIDEPDGKALAVVSWNEGGHGEFTVELARKGATS